MKTSRSALYKASALLPLAILSGGWTVTLAASSAGASDDERPIPLPDAIEAPASVSLPGKIAGSVTSHGSARAVPSVTSNGIPAAALAAYQRAAHVIDSADATCNLTWQLLAAIGRAESDHGRFGDNVLSAQGVSTPGIYGIQLNGRSGTTRIADTDAGLYDGDARFDRAVGPMQFIPATWSVVGVDGDGDRKRNPQDIDDASLASAVYLCSGSEDLSTEAGATAAIFRYNHSRAYVEQVQSIARAYTSGEYTSVPTSSYAPTYFGPAYDESVFDLGAAGHASKQAQKNTQATKQPGSTATSPEPPVQAPAPVEPRDGGDEPEKDPVKSLTETITKLPEALIDTLSADAAALNDLLGDLGLAGVTGGLLTKP